MDSSDPKVRKFFFNLLDLVPFPVLADYLERRYQVDLQQQDPPGFEALTPEELAGVTDVLGGVTPGRAAATEVQAKGLAV